MKASMDKYRVLVGIYMKMYRKYPMELFLKLVYLPVQMLMYIFLWKALLKYSGVQLSYMVCYYLFVVLLVYAFPFMHIATDIQKDVEQGIMANFLVRPVQYVVPVISRFVAWMVCYLVILVPAVLFTVIYREISLQPMKFYIYTPVNALLNGGNMEELAGNMVLALTWILVLTAAAAWQWNSGLKRLQANIS